MKPNHGFREAADAKMTGFGVQLNEYAGGSDPAKSGNEGYTQDFDVRACHCPRLRDLAFANNGCASARD